MAENIFANEVPALADLADGTPYMLATRFTPAVAGQMTHARWRFPATAPSPAIEWVLHRVSDFAQITSGAFPAGLANGYHETALSIPVDLEAGVQYSIGIRTTNRYVATTGYAWPKSNGANLTTAAPGGYLAVNPSGLALAGTPSGNGASFFADLVFVPEGAEPTPTPVSGSLDLRWQVRERVAGSLDLRWAVRNVVGGSLDLRWGVANVVTGALDLRWAVRSVVTGSLDLRWGVRSTVSGSLDLRWAVRQAVSGSLDLRWAQRERVSGSLEIRWGSAGSVSGSLALLWGVAEPVSGSLDLRWGVSVQISGSLDLRWMVIARVLGSLQLLWVVEGSGIPIPTTIRAYLTERFVADLRRADVVADLTER